jgi:beta-N-acetylhexosaminidase
MLREELGYRGLIVTDALNMAAVSGPVGEGKIAVQSLMAGADMILLPNDPVVVQDAIVEAMESGRLDRERVWESVRRILAMKVRFGLVGPFSGPVVGDARQLLGSAEHQSVARMASGETRSP